MNENQVYSGMFIDVQSWIKANGDLYNDLYSDRISNEFIFINMPVLGQYKCKQPLLQSWTQSLNYKQ